MIGMKWQIIFKTNMDIFTYLIELIKIIIEFIKLIIMRTKETGKQSNVKERNNNTAESTLHYGVEDVDLFSKPDIGLQVLEDVWKQGEGRGDY